MNPAKRILLSSVKLANSLYSNRLIRARSLYHQVTNFSVNPPLAQPRIATFLNTNQNLFFSSKPEPILDIVLSEDWSELLEQSNPKLTHENVVYVLKRLVKDPLKASKFFNWVAEKSGFEPSSAVYCLLFQILANKNSMKDFWLTVTKMKEQWLYIDEETYELILVRFKNLKMASDATALTQVYKQMVQDNGVDSVVKEVVEIVTRSDWGQEVENRLLEMKICVSDIFLLRALKELRQFPSKALKIFKWFQEGLSFKHNAVTYNAIVRVLGRYDSIEEFWSMVAKMKSEGHDLELDTYIKISRRFQKIKMLEDAVKLYELMMDGPYKTSVHECSLLLRIISANRNPDLDLVFRVVKKFEAAGNPLSKTIYDGIHRSLTSVGRFDEAEKIMETMRNAGYEPDNITYSQLIYGLGKAGRLEEACKVLDVMEVYDCIPDLKTWTILIKGHCAAGELDNALFYFAKMMEKNCDGDADLLEILVDGFLNQKRVAGAYTMLIELVKKARLRPWQATYKNLIEHLLGERKLEEALNLLHLMRKHNYPPFPEPFLQYISKFGTVEDALEFLKASSFKGYTTISAYQHMFQSLFQEGRHSEAKDLLYKCPLHVRKHQSICSLFGSVSSSSVSAA